MANNYKIDLTVHMHFGVADPHISEKEIREYVLRALQHSTATDAIQDALFARFEEAVEFECWEVE